MKRSEINAIIREAIDFLGEHKFLLPPFAYFTPEEWAEKKGIELKKSIEEVIEDSDCLVVLSPDNPEMHEELCKLPLASGKRTYVDKTFATSKAEAERIFENAEIR